MKIISNGEVYVKKSDIEFLSRYDRKFPLDLAIDHLVNNTEDKYIKITDQKQIEYILAQQDVMDFSNLLNMSKEEITKKIFRLKMKLLEESDKEEGMSPEEYRKAKIEAYKNRMRIEYLISQFKESLAYRKCQNNSIYPDVPNPNYNSLSDGQISSGISIKQGNIVFYKENGEEITKEEIDSSFYNTAVTIIESDLRYENPEDDKEFVERQSEDGKYLVLESRTIDHTNNKYKTRKLLNKSRSNQ